MKNLPSPAAAEAKQRRKLQYVPPLWPLLAVGLVIAGIMIAIHQ